MIKNHITIILFLLLAIPQFNFAQIKSPFDSLVSVLEKKYEVKIFYNSNKTKNIDVTGLSGNLDEILSNALKFSGLNISKDNGNRIFISENLIVPQYLPKDFFNPLNTKRTGPDIKLNTDTTVLAKNENTIYTIGKRNQSGDKAIITGHIRDARNGEPIKSSSITIEGQTKFSVSTDDYGYYSLSVPKGRHLMRVSSMGMKELTRLINVFGNGSFDLEMHEEIKSLKTIVIAPKQSNVRGMQMGVERLTIKTIKQIPAVFGETDIMRSILTLPGITSVGEGTAGYNVRGGSADQNLVLFNDMTIFNSTHLFGFFSAIDPEVVRGLDLYKSAIPEKFGGRISSIMDVVSRDGNSKKITGTAGLGPLTSKFTLEGPVLTEKTTFILGGRITYSNWILKQLDNPVFNKSSASFYDVSLNLTHTFSEKDKLYYSAYFSNDKFKFNADSTFGYQNQNMSLRWRHTFSNTLNATLSASSNQYRYSINGIKSPIEAFKLGFHINQSGIKSDFKYTPSNNHELNFGIQNLWYDISPGSLKPDNDLSIVTPFDLQKEKATELSLYIGDQVKINKKFAVQGGLRYSFYRYLGPRKVYTYLPGQPISASTVIDSISYQNNKLIKDYRFPEIRLSAKYLINENTSLKFSYNSLYQYIHTITNATSISPTDIFKLSDAQIKPQKGEQLSVGFYTQSGTKSIEWSLETYIKNVKNYLDYKSGAKLILNETLERDVISTVGKAYGAEFLIKKTSGKLNGWLSYTYSRTFLKANDSLAGEIINNGNYYPANFDKPHIINMVSNYKVSQRFSVSLTSTYSTGRPVTLPIGSFVYGGSPRVYYSDRNAFRIPDFFRTDFSMTLEGNHNLKQKLHTSWTFGVYNITGRDNPYSVYFVLEDGRIKGYQLSIFSTALPFMSFNVKF